MKHLFLSQRLFVFLLVSLFLLMPEGLFSESLLNSVTIRDEERSAATEDSSPFALDYYIDLGIAAGAVGLAVTGLVLDHAVDGWDREETFCKDDINAFDKIWYNEYRPAVDDLGTVAVVANVLVLPVGIYTTEAILQNLPARELVVLGSMLGESYLLGYGIRNIIKTNVRRTRPYMYTENWDWDSVDDGDYTLSFPSGHTTDAFMGATFLSYTFWKYYPHSNLRIPVIATSYTIAAATGFLRIASGNHFLTDVMAGAALGSAIGFLVPFVHEKIAAVKYRGRQVFSFDGQSLTATLRF